MASNQSADRNRESSDGLTQAASIARRADAKTWLRLIFFVFILAWVIVEFFVKLLAKVSGRLGVAGIVLACVATPALLIPMYLLRETEPLDGLLKEVGDNSYEPTRAGTVVLAIAFAVGVGMFVLGIVGRIRRWRRRTALSTLPGSMAS